MSILPIAFAVIVYQMNPGFFDIMFNTQVGRGLLIWCLISEAIGTIILHRLSKIEV